MERDKRAKFEIVPHDWERRPYFDYFYHGLKTKYNINHHIDITELLSVVKARGLRFYPTYIFVIVSVVNRHKEFRMSIDSEDNLGIWNYVVPSYTIFHDDNKSFSDIWSDYTPKFREFYQQAVDDMERYKDVKKVKAKPNRPPNFCPISALPWLSYHSISQSSYTNSELLFPIIAFGRFYEKDGRVLIPFSIFVNHAVADGYHTSKLINDIEAMGREVERWIDS